MFMSNSARYPLPMEHERPMGLETEYTVVDVDRIKSGERQFLPNKATLQIYMLSEKPQKYSASEYLANGSRFYIDVNGHPEYATPECFNGTSVAAATKAGEILVRDFVADTSKKRSLPGLLLSKRTLNPKGETVGDHENYYTRSTRLRSLAEAITPHLLSRIIFTGPGMVLNAENDGQFALDQRVWSLGNTSFGSNELTRLRPFVINRNEPLGNDGDRLQVMSASTNMLTAPIGFRFDSTSLVVRMFEHNCLPKSLSIEKPANAMRHLAIQKFSDNFNFTNIITLDDGRKLSAAQIQLLYAEKAQQLADRGDLNPYDTSFAKLWHEMAHDACEGNIDKWASRIEWLSKLAILTSYESSRSNGKSAQEIDLSMHDIPLSGRSIIDIMRSRGKITEIITAQDIHAAYYEAPDDLRGRARGNAIKALATSNYNDDTTWCKWPVRWTTRPDEKALAALQGSPFCNETSLQKIGVRV